jgi:hypothetical protein
MDVDTPELLRMVAKLKSIADRENLQIREAPLAVYFGLIIETKKDRFLAQAADKVLTKDEWDQALAEIVFLVKRKLTKLC